MNLLPKDRAEKILNWLRRGGVSRRQIARELGVHRDTITRVERRNGDHPGYEATRPVIRTPRVVLPLEIIERLDDEANQRRMSRADLMTTILATVAKDDLFKAVLG